MNGLYILIDGVEIPDWLIDAALCEPNKEPIEAPEIRAFTEAKILPIVQAQSNDKRSLVCSSNHVHVSDRGLTPHDHLPDVFTSVLYMLDAHGELILDPCGVGVRIQPKAGRLVIFKAEVVHEVQESPVSELRIALVSNYEYPTV